MILKVVQSNTNNLHVVRNTLETRQVGDTPT